MSQYDSSVETQASDSLMGKLLRERRTAREFQERRHSEWDENYQLYRNKVFINRLTQRQAVNIPLMKETIKTLLAKIDDPPIIEWKERSGDLEKEVVLQEIWNTEFQEQDFEGIDMLDKKNVLLYGRGFRKLNWSDDTVKIDPLDIYDIVVDPMTSPLSIETARFIIHQNLFKSLREILADERYSSSGKEKLKTHLMTPEGIVQSGKNKEEWEKKMERLKSMGVTSDEFPHFAGGDVIVNLCEHYTNVWDTKKKKNIRTVVVYANDQFELLNEPLVDLIGVDFWPFVTWGEDIETSDIWSDGPADLVRTPNKIVNVWFSQQVENRTLRNFQMHWYDATIQGYQPQTYEPGAGRMLPAPGNPSQTISPVQIDGLDETFAAIDFITKLVERGTAATAIEKGTPEENDMTLGEVKILVGSAMERTLSMAKFYRRAWKELAMKWYRMMDANDSVKRTLTKMSAKGRVWPKDVFPSDWKSKKGYLAMVRSSSEQDIEKTKGIQRFDFLMQKFPENSALKRIAQKRMLSLVDLNPDEIREIADEEKKRIEQQIEAAEVQAQIQDVQQQASTAPLDAAAGRIADTQGQNVLRDRLQQFAELAGGEDNQLTQRLNQLTNVI